MSEMLYTTLGDIAEMARNNFVISRERTDFVDIIKDMDKKGLLRSIPSASHPLNSFLAPGAFRSYAYSTTVEASRLLDEASTSDYIFEHTVAPAAKDIFSMVHLPYIQAEMHAHNYFEINYIYEGSCTQYFEQEQRQFSAGNLVIIAPESPHVVFVNDESFIVSFNIRKSTFDQVFWQLLSTNDMLSAFFSHSLYRKDTPNYLSFHIERPRDYEPLLQQLYTETVKTDDYANTMAVSLLNLFFGKLLREFSSSIHLFSEEKSTSFHQDFPLIIRYVQYNYATVSLPELSRLFHYSEVHISRMFKKYLNLSFSSMLKNLRLFHAKQYLETTEYPLTEIAPMVGYESAEYLSRIFKEKYGTAPSQFRRKNLSSG